MQTEMQSSKQNKDMRHIRQIIITLVWLLPTLGFAHDFEVDGIYYNMRKLKESGQIRRVGPDKGGHWEIIDAK